MAEDPTRGERDLATELPSNHLPAVEYRDLPEPVPIRKIIGASVIIAATALGSGQFILWPYVTSQVGFTVFWACILGFTFQWFINMEVERYALATGETAVTGFARLWRHWGVVFILFAILPNFWPGWASGAATMVTFTFGGGNVAIIAVIALFSIGLALTLSPVVYQTVEKVQMVMIVIIVSFIVFATIVATTGDAWGAWARGSTVEIGQNLPGAAATLGAATLMGAIAFAGAGGTNNLVQANWIRDKQMGMGAYIPQIVSPVTGEEEATPGTGYMMRSDEENVRRFWGWWRVANQEHFITFFVIGLTTTTVLCTLTYATVGVGEEVGEEFGFIQAQGQALAQQIAPWFQTLFYMVGTVILFSTNLGILDYVSRLVSDALKVDYLEENETFTMSRLYFIIIWSLIIIGSLILLSGLDEPLVLLIISSAMSGFIMVVYTALLIMINRRFLPEAIKMRSYRLVAMVLAFLFYSFFVGWMIVGSARELLG